MESAPEHVKQKLEQLFSTTAEVAVEMEAARWDPKRPPHYSQIEQLAHQLARQLSCRIQQQLTREAAAQALGSQADCPGCGQSCELEPQTRTVQSIDGPVELLELKGFCRPCRRSFFPSAGSAGSGQPRVDTLPGAADCLRGDRDTVG